MINILYPTSFVKRFARKICVFSVILCIFSPVSRRVFRRENQPAFRFFLDKSKKSCKIWSYRSYITNLLHIFILCEPIISFFRSAIHVTNLGKERNDFMLKKRTTLTTLLITAMFLIGGAFTALAADSDGSFDDFEGSTIVGWGWDSSLPNTGVPVTVTITNKETGEQVKSFHQTAVTYRSDLEENGIGNGPPWFPHQYELGRTGGRHLCGRRHCGRQSSFQSENLCKGRSGPDQRRKHFC